MAQNLTILDMKICVLILENLRSVENTGSIFRTAEGLGVSKIVCVGTTPTPLDRFSRKRTDFAKVALGAEEMVDWEYAKAEDLQQTADDLRQQGFKILALEQYSDSTPLQAVSSKLQAFALIVGNEVEGVSQEALALSDEVVEIPMRGKKESLNVSVATGIALYALMVE